ncbi:MAG TPA: ParB/RepB/Spo0J family partition protein [Bellilinea sp.]|nr:ParB/RepB/Spo0J family partition protein [Bellilinea sp.]
MARKSGLGKGLGALIPNGTDGEVSASETGTLFVGIDQILPNPAQPRQAMEQESLAELAASIREHGILQPLIVSLGDKPDQYILIAGERRWRAARLVGMTAVPAIVRQATDQQRLEMALIENLQRADLAPLDTAEAYRQLAEEFKLSHDEIAERVGKSRTTVTNTLRLLRLPDAVRIALVEGKISEGHARALLGLNSPQAQAAVLQNILANDLSVRQTEELVRRYSGERAAPVQRAEPSPEIKSLEARLRDSLGTRVTLRHGKKGGTLVIHYYSDEELDGLISQILRD